MKTPLSASPISSSSSLIECLPKHILLLLLLSLATLSLTTSALPEPNPLPAIFRPPSTPPLGGGGADGYEASGAYRARSSNNIALSLSSQAQRLLLPLSSHKSSTPDHPTPHHQYGDLELLDLVLISTVDGGLHALERSSGRILWSRSAGSFGIPLSESPHGFAGGNRMGLVDAQYKEGLFDARAAKVKDISIRGDGLAGDDVGKPGSEPMYIVEPSDGQLFVYLQGQPDDEAAGNIQRLPLTMEQLIDLSPFTFPHESSHIFLGSKSTSLRAIDLKTGEDIGAFGLSNCEGIASRDAGLRLKEAKARAKATGAHHIDERAVGDDEEEDPKCITDISERPEDKLFIGQSVNDLSIHSHSDGLLQRLRLSSIVPNAIHRDLSAYWARSGNVKGEGYTRSKGRVSPDGGSDKYSGRWKGRKEDETVELEARWRVEGMQDGTIIGLEQEKGVRWFAKVGSVAISIFDVLLPTTPGSHPILLPQPPAHIPSLFPSPAHTVQLLSQPDSAFLSPIMSSAVALITDNITREDSHDSSESTAAMLNGFYAMSSKNYPLVTFAIKANGASLGGLHIIQEAVKERLPFLLEAGESTEEIDGAVDPPLIGMGDARALQAEGVVIHYMLEQLGTYQAMAAIAVLLAFGAGLWYARRAPKLAATTESQEVSSGIAEGSQAGFNKPSSAPNISVTQSQHEKVANLADNAVMSTGTELVLANPDTELSEPATKKPNGRRRKRGKKHRELESDNAGEEGVAGGHIEADRDSADELDLSSLIKARADAIPEPPRTIMPVTVERVIPAATPSIDIKAVAADGLTVTDEILGLGSHGTVVFKGRFQGRAVAVKRLLQDFVTIASQEVSLLQASDDHQNVIRYYYQEKRDNFLYIALELCPASLADVIDRADEFEQLAADFAPKKALHQITAGLRHLHDLKIVHRDLKPQNVLISVASNGAQRMLLSDFGLAKRLDHGQSSYAQTGNHAVGSVGWRAPECLRGEVQLDDMFDGSSSSAHSTDKPGHPRREPGARLTKAVDLFALGCIYFWVLTNGSHPYGDRYEREVNIMRDTKVNLPKLEMYGEEGHEAALLISSLLSPASSERPDTPICLIHPMFWTPERRLNFLCDASDRFEIMELNPPEAMLAQLERGSFDVIGQSWQKRLDTLFLDNLGKHRKYDSRSVRDLLRAMRNKKHHYQDLPENVKRRLGPLPIGFLAYFTSRFPQLFSHVHRTIGNGQLREEAMFAAYFVQSDS